MNRYEMNTSTGKITVKPCKSRASRRAAPTCSAIKSKFADDWPTAPYGYKWSGTSWEPRKTKRRKPNKVIGS